MWHVRNAAVEDVARLAEIHTHAYPVPRAREFRERRFTHNPMGPLDNAFVVTRDSSPGAEVVAHGFVHSSHMRMRDAWVPCGAIASIGVAPEARGQGVARALVERLHEHSRSRGDAITVLYPFREGFYVKLGYGRVTAYRRLAFATRSIAQIAPSGSQEPALRRARVSDAVVMDALYTQSGITGTLARTPSMWEQRIGEEESCTLITTTEGKVRGLISYTLDQTMPHAETRARITDLHYLDAPTRIRLLAHVGSLRDQVSRVELDVANDDATELLMHDADQGTYGAPEVEHALGHVVAGPMVRMHGIEALTATTYAADGTLRLEIAGSNAVTMTVTGGKAKLGEQPCEDVLSIDRATLGRVVFGGVPIRSIVEVGLAKSSSARALERAASLFAIRPYFSYDAF